MADKKYVDGGIANSAYNLTTNPTTISAAIGTGTTDSLRVGNQIDVRSLTLNIQINTNTAGGVANQATRIIVGCWNDYRTDTTPLNSDLLVFSGTSTALNAMYERDVIGEKGWIPMYDRVVYHNTDADAGPLMKIIKLKFFGKRLPKKRKHFTAGGLADSVYFWMLINDDIGVNNNHQYTQYRMTFTDV